MTNNKGISPKKKAVGTCESCEFYAYVCVQRLDQDEMADFLGRNTNSCPYYRFYDEYKSVHKQI